MVGPQVGAGAIDLLFSHGECLLEVLQAQLYQLAAAGACGQLDPLNDGIYPAPESILTMYAGRIRDFDETHQNWSTPWVFE